MAWWRTGIVTAGVALAVGGILPKLSNVARDRAVALGVGYGVLALGFVIGGSLRSSDSRKALESGSFSRFPSWAVATITTYISALIIFTVVALFLAP